jgi:tetratricopeptide (TPR) repeat protein
MKAILIVLCILFAGLAASALFLGGGKAVSDSAHASAPSELADLRADLKTLEQRVDALQKEHSTKLESSGSSRVSQSEIDAAVERALAARTVPAGSQDAGARAAGAAPKLDAQSAYAALTDPNLSWDERRKKWSEFAKAGLLDELVALYEKQASENPNDPKAQTALGNAYLQKIFNGAQGPEAGIWGTKADKAFDRALALDDHNWEARFTKAVSLSNWPAFLGKQPEAIANLETLVQQQSQGTLKPEYAQTYLILGNLYKQTGKNDQALAMWQQGLALFPEMAEFQKQIQLAQH